MKKGMIFDLDGVIVSTDHYHYLAWKAIAGIFCMEAYATIHMQRIQRGNQ